MCNAISTKKKKNGHNLQDHNRVSEFAGVCRSVHFEAWGCVAELNAHSNLALFELKEILITPRKKIAYEI